MSLPVPPTCDAPMYKQWQSDCIPLPNLPVTELIAQGLIPCPTDYGKLSLECCPIDLLGKKECTNAYSKFVKLVRASHGVCIYLLNVVKTGYNISLNVTR